MPWLRVGDTASTHPTVIAVDDHPAADVAHSLACEVFGFVALCATMAAQHLTDYVVSFPAAQRVAGSRQRAAELLDLAEWAGYGVNTTDDDGRRVFQLAQDPDLLHMRTADEIAAERQRKADTGNLAVTVPVRHRDGDQCRYCGVRVAYSDRRSARGLTYDHRSPLTMPGTVETMVVACRACNGARGAIAQQYEDHAAGLAAADAAHPLRPVPADPYYSPATLALFKKHGTPAPESPQPSPDPSPQPPQLTPPADNQQVPADNQQVTSGDQQIPTGTGYGRVSGSGTGRDPGRVPGRDPGRVSGRAGQRPQPRRKGRGRR